MSRVKFTLFAFASIVSLVGSVATAKAESDDRDDCDARGAAFCHADGRAVRERVVAAFDGSRGENLENLIVGDDGVVYVTELAAHTVARVTPQGHRRDVVLPAGEVAGIAIHPWRPELTVTVISSDPEVAGLWTLPLSAFRGEGSPRRAVALPPDGFPNGITYDDHGNLYVADSVLARIWRVSPGSDTATVWLQDALLAPTGAAFNGIGLPGANGVKIALGRIWVSNTSSQQLLSAPLARDGSPGPLSVTFQNVYGLDDFVVTPCGGIVAALNVAGQVVAITPDGTVRVLQDAATGARNPSAVAFSRNGVYVTNSAYFTPGPSLERLEL